MTYCYRPNIWKYIFMKNPFSSMDTSFIWQTKARHEWNCFFGYDNNILRINSKKLIAYIMRNKYDLYTVKRELYLKRNIYRILWIPVGSLGFCFGKNEYGNRKSVVKNIFLQMYPNYDGIINDVQEESKYYVPLHRHMFIMKSEMFLDYANWLFDYLFEVEKYVKKCIF